MGVHSVVAEEEWTPAESPLSTPWAKEVGPDNALPEHPRPQMQRSEWLNLNGLWDYQIEPVAFEKVVGLTEKESLTTGSAPSKWQGKLLVPYAIDSSLSGVGHVLRPNERIWYRRTFTIPKTWNRDRVKVHFQAVDWEASVYVNGKRLGQHRGGYTPFHFDVTEALKEGVNELVVCAWDATEWQCQAIGKQITPEGRKGFRYQPTGGIWQTVWIEGVQNRHIESVRLYPDIDSGTLNLDVSVAGEAADLSVLVEAMEGGRTVAQMTTAPGVGLELALKEVKLWSPENPFLYDLRLTLRKGEEVLDTVNSYFGMRKMESRIAEDGFRRIFLNNKPVFQFGPLDQGYWPDGILTPPTDGAIQYDLSFLKDIGCNMVRVHMKVHPERWYYWADRIGLLVNQDFVCTPKFGQKVTPAASKQWQQEAEEVMEAFHNHPSIIHWTVFNEAWGQHDTGPHTEWTMKKDPSRIVTDASGWSHKGAGQIVDYHDYSFYPSVRKKGYLGGLAAYLGEAGGINMVVPDHVWYQDVQPSDKFDYSKDLPRSTFGSQETFREGYAFWAKGLGYLRELGGCNGVIYTQLSDIEHELNGFLTYDRVPKISREEFRNAHRGLYESPTLSFLIAEDEVWNYQMRQERPKGGKEETLLLGQEGDGVWKTGVPPFAARKGEGVKTEVSGNVLYACKEIQLEDLPKDPVFCVTTGKKIDLYINGHLVRALGNPIISGGGRPSVQCVPLREEDKNLFKPGKNVISYVIPKFGDRGFAAVTLFDVQHEKNDHE